MSPTIWRPPPNWPTPPDGWSPPPGWQPAPDWGPAPPGWEFWNDDTGHDAPGGPCPDDPRQLVLGHRAARKWRQTEPGLRACLDPGEEVRGFYLANSLRPITDYIAVTSTRVIAGAASDLTRTPPRFRAVPLAEAAGIESEPAPVTRTPKLTLRRRDGRAEFVGQLLDGKDEPAFRAAFDLGRTQGRSTPAAVSAPPVGPTAASRAAVSDTSSPSLLDRPSASARRDGAGEDHEARIGRLLQESVIDERQASYVRSVLQA